MNRIYFRMGALTMSLVVFIFPLGQAAPGSRLSLCSTRDLYAELSPASGPTVGQPGESTPAGAVSADNQKMWHDHMDQLKTRRTLLMLLGAVGVIGGAVTYVNGYSENQSAGDVPGCSRSGNSVLCADQTTTDEAQNKIDSGLRGMAVGGVVALVGVVLFGFGLRENSKFHDLEAEGRRRGFVLDYTPQNSGQGRLVYYYKY